MSEETKQLIEKCKKAAHRKLKHIKIDHDNIEQLIEFDKELSKISGNYVPVFIIDHDRRKIYTDNAGFCNASVYTYEQYVNKIWMLLTHAGCTVYKENGEMMKDEEWSDMAIKKLNKLPLTYNPTNEEIINKIIELCEKDTDRKEYAAEWIISKSKYINKWLYVSDIQKECTDSISINDILLYAQTDGGDDLLTFKAWGDYESIGQGDDFSKEELTKLLNELKKIY